METYPKVGTLREYKCADGRIKTYTLKGRANCGKSPNSIKHRFKKNSTPRLGKPHSLETKQKISKANKGKLVGAKNPAWKGGVTPEYRKCRKSKEYKIWRDSVYKKDDYTCQGCGKRGGNMNAHHVLCWSDFPHKRYDIANGITLCLSCHQKQHPHIVLIRR